MKLGMARCHACGQTRTDIGAQVRCDKCGKVVHEKEAHTLSEPMRLPEQYVPQRPAPKQQQAISAFTPRKVFDLCEDCANELQASFFKREVP